MKKNLSSLSNEEFIQQFHKVVSTERRVRSELAGLLRAIDQNKTWWDMGYSSLYKYCEQELKMTLEEVDEILSTV